MSTMSGPGPAGGPNLLADETNTFYLTRAPGRTGDVSGFWEATLTPNDANPTPPTLVGYRGAGLSIPGFTHEAAGAGTLAPGTMSLGGVTYTVDVLAIVSDETIIGWNLSLRTDPLLPRGQDLWLELGHVDGSTAVFAIDTASVEAPGYLWRAVYAGEDRHGWGTDGSDADTDIDSVTVRLSLGAPTITGTAQVGETLTAVTTGITDADGLTSPTYTYQWIRVNGTAADIAGANSSTYTLVDADLGKAIKVKVSFTDDASNAETRTSAATATVTADPTTQTTVWSATLTPADVGSSILGCNSGNLNATLQCSNSAVLSEDEFTHDSTDYTVVSLFLQPNGTFTIDVDPALTTATAALTLVVGSTILDPADGTVEAQSGTILWTSSGVSLTVGTAVSVSLVSGTGTVSTNAAPTVANAIQDQTATVGTALDYAFPANTFADADSDTLTYTATKSDDTALPSWLSFAAATRTFSGTPAAADVETVSVKVTASDATESVSDTFDIVVDLPADTSPTLVSNAGQGDDHSWSNSKDRSQAFTTSAGATLSSVEIISEDPEGDDVAVSLCTVDGSNHPTSSCIVLTAPSSFAIGTLVFRAPANTTLAANTTYSLLVASPGDEFLVLDATYSEDEDAGGATGWSIADTFDVEMSSNTWVANSDRALRITIKGTITASSNNAATGAPTITGTAQVGETLTAVTTGITDADGLTSVTYTYQWIRANGTEADIASANSSTYVLDAADLGKTIKVKVSFEDDAGNAETLTSAATATVVAVPTAPMVTDVDVTSSPDSGDTYGTGEMILFTVTFDQAVTVTGAPEFEFCLGTTSTMSCDMGAAPPARRRAALSSGSGTTMLVFGYTVVEGDMDDNGIWTGDQSRTIKLEGGTIQGTVGGLDAVLTHAEEGQHGDHKVNGATANTAPTAADNTVTTAEDRAYTFTAADFGFMDADAGAALASVKIVTVPGAGELALDGTAVMAADVVTEAQIDADMLTFRPAQDAHGAPYTTFTFKVNDGTDDSADAYTMTIDVTDAPAPVCVGPDIAGDGRREIWTGTVTVEEFSFMGSVSGYGFDPSTGISSLLPSAEFSIGSNNHTIVALGVVTAGDLYFNVDTNLTATEEAALRLHVCDEDLDFSVALNDTNNPSYAWTGSLDWSHPVVTRTVYLSLPANHDATGEPAISGTAQAGQDLTADASPILDTDGLTGVDFTYQWLRVDADGTSNPADITDATAATYTLTAADAGKKIKVQVSFTDELSGEEERTSAAYPSSGTVTASTNTTAPMLLSVTVTSTPHKTTDTYGAREHIEFSMTFDAPVTVTGDPTFGFDLGGASTASWYAGSGTTTLRFSHAVSGGSSGDRDTNGISWAQNAIELNGGTIAGTENAVTAILTHAAQSNLAAHKVDGRTTAVTPATVTVAVTSTPTSLSDTYGFGETIVITVTASEAVEVVGDPVFQFSLTNPGGAAYNPQATYDRTRSSATTIVFTYTVQAGDRDTNGIWIGTHSQTFMLDANDRIRTASQKIDIDRSHPQYGTHTGHKVDGSLGGPTVPPDPTAPTLVSATATTLTIEWTHPGDGGSPLTRNFIEYRVEGTTAWTNWYRGETPTQVTRAVITNLEAETAYDVRVHSTNAIGNSQWVQSATAFSTLADDAPAPTMPRRRPTTR